MAGSVVRRVALGFLLVACGPQTGADVGVADAGLTDARPGRVTPAAPMPPMPPLFVCPPGWRTFEVLGVDACEPYAEDALPTCGAHQLLLPGQPLAEACQDIAPCPSGAWPDDAPSDALYVAVGATGGDGTRDRPYGTLAAAAAVGTGRTIVLGEGTHRAGGPLRGVARVVGLCPARTTIYDATPTMSAPIIVTGTLAISNVHLDGENYGLWVAATGRVMLDAVEVSARGSAIRVDGGGVLDGRRVRAETPVDRDAYLLGTIYMGPSATVTLRSSSIRGGGTTFFGYKRATDPSDVFSTLVLEDSSILDTPVGVSGRIDATLRRIAIDRVGLASLVIPERSIELVDVRVRQAGVVTLLPTSISNPDALVVYGSADLTRVRFVDSRAAFIAGVVGGARGHVVARDIIVHRSTSEVLVTGFGSVEAERIVVGDVMGTAFQAIEGGTMTLTDVGIRDIAALDSAGNTFDIGLSAILGGQLDVARAHVEGVAGGSLVVEDATGTVTDLDVVGGTGIGSQCDVYPCTVETLLTLDRVRVVGASRGIYGIAGSIELSNALVTDVERELDDPLPGIGVLASFGGTVRGHDVHVARVEGLGVLSLRDGLLELTGLEVDATRPIDCPSCGLETYYGDGIICAAGGQLTLDDFSSHGAARGGLVEAEGCPEPTLGTGDVFENAIGILTDLGIAPPVFARVTVRDNGLAIQQQRLVITPEDVGL